MFKTGHEKKDTCAQFKCVIMLMQADGHSMRQALRVTSMCWSVETGKFAPGKGEIGQLSHSFSLFKGSFVC